MAKLKGGTTIAGSLTVEDTVIASVFETPVGDTYITSEAGVTNTIPKYAGVGSLANSNITDDGSIVTITADSIYWMDDTNNNGFQLSQTATTAVLAPVISDSVITTREFTYSSATGKWTLEGDLYLNGGLEVATGTPAITTSGNITGDTIVGLTSTSAPTFYAESITRTTGDITISAASGNVVVEGVTFNGTIVTGPTSITTGALTVDNISIDGNTISTTAGTDLLITPLAGQQIVLDGTIVIDAGVITGATSITSTSFVGDLTGVADSIASTTDLAVSESQIYIDTDAPTGTDGSIGDIWFEY